MIIVCATADRLGLRRARHLLGHDLADLTGYYPLLEELLGHTRIVAAAAGGSGRRGGLSVPVNLTVLEFVDGTYDDDPVADSTAAGVKHTVVDMERHARQALDRAYTPRPRAAGYTGLGLDSRVVDALGWLRANADVLDEQAVDQLRGELHRLNTHAEHLLYGARFTSTWSRCPDCDSPGPAGLGTVVAGVMAAGRMAVCVNWPTCAGEDGARSCWRFDPDVDEWQRIPEPAGSRLDVDASRVLTAAASDA